jgi:hypothetical protein
MSNSNVNPPRWAENLLRRLAGPRDQDTISGDLLEEYRERFLSAGVLRAKLWYFRQLLSFLTLPRLAVAAGGHPVQDEVPWYAWAATAGWWSMHS